LVQLRDIESQFTELGFQLIGISPDQPTKVRKTAEKQNISFTLLSDRMMAASKAFGIAYQVDEATLKPWLNTVLIYKQPRAKLTISCPCLPCS
jgi:peroxiredoxin